MDNDDKNTYRVTWEVDVFDGEGPVDVALKAQELQQLDREDYEVGVFHVLNSEGIKFKVNLNNETPTADRIDEHPTDVWGRRRIAP